MLQQKGFLIQEVSLAGTNSIPANCRLLITAGPRTPYSPSELAKLREYLGSGGSLFALFNFYSLPRPSGLESFLADYEFEVGINQVSDSKNEQSGEWPFVGRGSRQPPDHQADPRRRLQMVLPRSVGFPSRRRKTTTRRRCRCSRIRPTPGRRWCRRRAIRARSRSRAGFPLAAAKVHANEGQPPARIVVAGDSLFLGNSAFEAGANRDFANLTVNWLLERTHLLEIEPRAVTEYRISLSRSEMTSITWVLLLLPGGTLGLGLLWWRRQMKRS